MYFYIIDGYTTETTLVVSQESDADGGVVEVYTPVYTQIPTRKIMNYSEMLEAYDNGDTCYIGIEYQPDSIERYTDGTVITPEILEELEAEHEQEEIPVGSPDTRGNLFEFTTYTYSISSVSANASLTDSVTPTKEGYDLIGVVGFSVVSTSGLIPFRVYVDEGALTIGLRNVTSSAITDKTMKIHLMWQRVTLLQDDELVGIGNDDDDSEEVVG